MKNNQDFHEPSDSTKDISAILFPEPYSMCKDFTLFLQDLLLDKYQNFDYLADVATNQEIELLQYSLNQIINQTPGQCSFSYKKFWFLFISRNILGETYFDLGKIKSAIEKLQWDEIFNQNAFIRTIDLQSALHIQTKMHKDENFQKSVRKLPFETRYRILNLLEKYVHGGIPIALLEDIDIANPYFGIEHYWIFGLDRKISNILLNASVDTLDLEMLDGLEALILDDKLRFLLLKYGYKENYNLLDKLYINTPLIDICKNINTFITNGINVEWFYSFIGDDIDRRNADTVLKLLPGINNRNEIRTDQELKADLINYIKYRLDNTDNKEKTAAICVFIPLLNRDPLGFINSQNDIEEEFIQVLSDFATQLAEIMLSDDIIPYLEYNIFESLKSNGRQPHLSYLQREILNKLAVHLLHSKKKNSVSLLLLYLIPDQSEYKNESERFPGAIGKYIFWYFTEYNNDTEILSKLFTLGISEWEYEYQQVEWISLCVKQILTHIRSRNTSNVNIFKNFPNLLPYTNELLDSDIVGIFKNISTVLFQTLIKDFANSSDTLRNPDSMLIAALLIMIKNANFEDFINLNMNNITVPGELYILKAFRDAGDKRPTAILQYLYKKQVPLISIVDLLDQLKVNQSNFINLAYKQWSETIPLPSMEAITDFCVNVRPVISTPKNETKSKFDHLYLNMAGIQLLKLVSREYEKYDDKNNQSRCLNLLCLVNYITNLDTEKKVSPDNLESINKYIQTLFIHLRKKFRQKLDDRPDSNYFGAIEHAATITARTQGPWQSLKPLLSAFRFLPELALPSNLDASWKSTESENIYNYLPRIIQFLFKFHIDNGNWLLIRRNFANDLINKLKPKKRGTNQLRQGTRTLDTTKSSWIGFDESKNEPDPLWRYAYIRAIRDLGINADGKGHYFSTVLAKVAHSDKSPRVREQAEKIAQELQSYRTGVAPGKKRDKTRLLEAWWWLRYAHVLFHEGQVDKEGSEKIRTSEIR
jgi:hypothetical protein